jgi:hypothetical protein
MKTKEIAINAEFVSFPKRLPWNGPFGGPVHRAAADGLS